MSHNKYAVQNGQAHVEVFLQICQLAFKHLHYFLLSCLSIQYGDSISGTRSNVNHFMKRGVLKCLNRLCELRC